MIILFHQLYNLLPSRQIVGYEEQEGLKTIIDEQTKKVKKLEHENKKLRDQKDQIETENEELKKEIGDVHKMMAVLKLQTIIQENKCHGRDTKIEALRKAVDEYKTQVKELEHEKHVLNDHREQIETKDKELIRTIQEGSIRLTKLETEIEKDIKPYTDLGGFNIRKTDSTKPQGFCSYSAWKLLSTETACTNEEQYARTDITHRQNLAWSDRARKRFAVKPMFMTRNHPGFAYLFAEQFQHRTFYASLYKNRNIRA